MKFNDSSRMNRSIFTNTNSLGNKYFGDEIN